MQQMVDLEANPKPKGRWHCNGVMFKTRRHLVVTDDEPPESITVKWACTIELSLALLMARICDDMNARGIGSVRILILEELKKEGIDSRIKSKELAIGGTDGFSPRSTKMAHLMAVME
ncbi:hypothetical protein HYC85_019121 [Camellia sinensis]|uniref:Uncharacterized protein n=1 Tax=Camellia sinensis TaxID=4442 RepID=A0A7J7GKY7_CAMSI|nr:hypothetical protein HYC85_019121 [Camellia sinensis]